MNRIDEIITKTINKFLKENINTEANNNLPIHEFDNDMKSLGFIKDIDRSGSRVIYKLKNGGLVITTHDPGKTAKADMLRNVFDNLVKIKWFDNPNNFKIFPFKKWGFNPNTIKIDVTECKSVEESTNKVKEYIKIKSKVQVLEEKWNILMKN